MIDITATAAGQGDLLQSGEEHDELPLKLRSPCESKQRPSGRACSMVDCPSCAAPHRMLRSPLRNETPCVSLLEDFASLSDEPTTPFSHSLHTPTAPFPLNMRLSLRSHVDQVIPRGCGARGADLRRFLGAIVVLALLLVPHPRITSHAHRTSIFELWFVRALRLRPGCALGRHGPTSGTLRSTSRWGGVPCFNARLPDL